MAKNLVINGDPVKEKHLCYYTERDDVKTISLYEVVKATYPHPDAPEHATVECVETRFRKSCKAYASSGAPLVLLEAAQANMETLDTLG